ncbi:MAG: NAD(P)H-dependent oxidoreductase subunit E [Saprospiraceae bacterium]|nr:NAD(P)H-dependent oxidoreductase subunit E [Saprospiraceae bacterium]
MVQNINHIIDNIISQTGTSVDKVIPILQAIQNEFNYLPEEALRRVCETTDITPSRIYGVSTFYTQFRHKPVGKHIIKVCVGTACHVKGAMLVFDAFKRKLNLEDREDTDSNGLFTLDQVACLGCCTIAPVVQIDDITYGHVASENVSEILDDFLKGGENKSLVKFNSKTINQKSQGEIKIGLGSCCVASGSSDVKNELEKALNRSNINVDVKQVGCIGICNQVPMMEIEKPNEETIIYTKIKPEEVKEIIHQHFKPIGFTDRLKSNFNHFFDKYVFEGIPKYSKRYMADQRDTPVSEFLNEQINIATEFRGVLKPTDISEYKSLGGFKALEKCLNLSQDEIIDIIYKSGLKGRGGAGFLAALKWKDVKKFESDIKYIICNGDEGDPGAFMDRMLLESYPFRIIEGIIIAAYTVGAREGMFYIRAEYPLAVKRVNEALEKCRQEGLIGENILNSGFSFELKIFEGAGAFVCGEETALVASIEGKRGLPRIRPPFPSESGLWGKPTLINNTETYSLISWIMKNGADAFNKIGTENSKGTKVFALAGKINRGGLIEVPMGITIRKIVEEIGGGIPNGKAFKAVQIGGPSGGCIPASLADTPIDFGSLSGIGAMMGSGGLVVLDETDCMVDIARYFLSFTQDQSCGRCTYCRVGTKRMLEILDKITTGKAVPEDLVTLENLCYSVIKGSICGLGKSAPNPVLSTLKYFREEYEAHINGKCPTGKCKNLTTYFITTDCIGCTKCAQNCPSDAIIAKPYEQQKIDSEKCIKCDICKQICPVGAVKTR